LIVLSDIFPLLSLLFNKKLHAFFLDVYTHDIAIVMGPFLILTITYITSLLSQTDYFDTTPLHPPISQTTKPLHERSERKTTRYYEKQKTKQETTPQVAALGWIFVFDTSEHEQASARTSANGHGSGVTTEFLPPFYLGHIFFFPFPIVIESE